MLKLNTILKTILLVQLTLLVGCSDLDGRQLRCMDADITVINNCDQNIGVRYERLYDDDEFIEDLFEYIFNLEGCELGVHHITIAPGQRAHINLFYGTCYENWEPDDPGMIMFDCRFFNDDTDITVNYNEIERDIITNYGDAEIEVELSDFQ